jgi:hypothetical protein
MEKNPLKVLVPGIFAAVPPASGRRLKPPVAADAFFLAAPRLTACRGQRDVKSTATLSYHRSQ